MKMIRKPPGQRLMPSRWQFQTYIPASIEMLLKQCCYWLETLPPNLEEAYNRYQKSGEKQRPDLDEFTELLIDCCQKFNDRVFFLIDAFDECAERERPIVVTCLKRLQESGIRLLLTTRTHLSEDLRTELNSEVLEIRAQQEDVKTYLSYIIEAKAKHLRLDFRTELVDSISNGVDGKSAVP